MSLPTKRPVLVQGITGKHGRFHTERMLAYGTQIVAGVTPGKGGESVAGVPVYNSVAEALAHHQSAVTICFVPPAQAAAALHEAMAAGITEIICITEGIPVRDMVEVLDTARQRGTAIIGPNTPGVIIPGVELLGIISPDICRPGPIGVVSRSGTLTYETAAALSAAGIGQREIIGIGGDMVRGLSFIDVLTKFEADPEVQQIVLIGEIGGTDEQRAAEFIEKNITKPVHAFIAGASAPPATQLGHAGAIIGGEAETAHAKRLRLQEAGVTVYPSISQLVDGLQAAA